MKIKLDFITNSSSTSFILATKNDFQKEKFLKIIGVKSDSEFKSFFERFFSCLKNNMKLAREYYRDYRRVKYDSFEEFLIDNFSEDIAKKILKSEKRGKKIYIGALSSDTDEIESFFCCSSFEFEKGGIYINGLNCTW